AAGVQIPTLALTTLSALAYAAAFPPLSWSIAPWLALAPLLVACGTLSPLRAAMAGMWWAAVAGLGVVWFLPEMLSYGRRISRRWPHGGLRRARALAAARARGGPGPAGGGHHRAPSLGRAAGRRGADRRRRRGREWSGVRRQRTNQRPVRLHCGWRRREPRVAARAADARAARGGCHRRAHAPPGRRFGGVLQAARAGADS